MTQFTEGNQAAAKGRRVEKMIERACMQEDDKRLRQGVETVLNLFANGEKWAVEYVTDRLDGKPAQAVKLSGDEENPINVNHGLSDPLTQLLNEIIGERS